MTGQGSPPPPGSAVNRRTVLPVFLAALAGGFVLLGGIFLGPLSKALSREGLASLIYAVYSPLCHQIPERSFEFLGFPMTVCGRCLGIYAGFVAGTFLYPFVRGFSRLALPRPRVLLALTLPLVVDGLAGLLGLWATPMLLRSVTGFLWGGLLPFYFIPGVASAIIERKSSGRSTGPGDLEIRPGKNIE
jgi:uncharacterized membrane protein